MVLAGVVVPRRGQINQSGQVTVNFGQGSAQQVVISSFHCRHSVRPDHLFPYTLYSYLSQWDNTTALLAVFSRQVFPQPLPARPLATTLVLWQHAAKASAQSAPGRLEIAVRPPQWRPTKFRRRPSTSETEPKCSAPS